MLPKQLLMREKLKLVSVLKRAPGRGVHGGPQWGCPVHQLRWGMSRDAVRQDEEVGWKIQHCSGQVSLHQSQGMGDVEHQAMQKCNQKYRGESSLPLGSPSPTTP